MLDCQSNVSRLPVPPQQLLISYWYYHLLLPLSGTLCATSSPVLISVRQDCFSCPQKVELWDCGVRLVSAFLKTKSSSMVHLLHPSLIVLQIGENLSCSTPASTEYPATDANIWQQFSWEILKYLGSLCKSRAVFHSFYILTIPCLDEFVGHCARFCPHTGPCVLSLYVR